MHKAVKSSNNCRCLASSSPQSLEESGAWQRVNTQVPIRSPRYAVFDLAEGKQYRFRVLSANMYGCSEPSEPTGAVETQELKGELPSFPVVGLVFFFSNSRMKGRSVGRGALRSGPGDRYQGNRHLRPHPVGSTKGAQQSDWLLH